MLNKFKDKYFKIAVFVKLLFQDSFYPYRLFTYFTVSFLVGVLLSDLSSLNFNRSWLILTVSFFLSILLLIINLLWQVKYLWLINLVVVFCLLGVFYQAHFAKNFLKEIGDKRELVVTGEVVAKPEVDYKNQKIIMNIWAIEQESEKGLIGSNVLIKAPIYPIIYYGDSLKIMGVISKPEKINDFDYGNYLKAKQVIAIMQPKEVTYVSATNNILKKTVKLLYQLADNFEQKINRTLPEPHSSLASGILLGVKKNIPNELMENFKKTGLTHIIALSGFNVTIIIAIFAESVVAYIGRKRTFFIGMMLVLAFVIMTGGSLSVVRAAIFSFLILFARLIGRPPDQTNLMLLAALILILFNPYTIAYDTGFQLSFLAFAGLLYLSPKIRDFFEKKKVPNGIGITLAETLGAQAAVLPILIFNFKTLSIISPLANLAVLWCLPYVMLLTSIIILSSSCSPALGNILAWLLWPLLQYIIVVVEYLAKIPFGAITF